MTNVTTTNQTEVSGFYYRKNNLASIPVGLYTFGDNIVESLSKSKGSLNPVYRPNPIRPGSIEIVDLRRGAPELGELSFRERLHLYAYNFLEQEFNQDCDGVFIFKLDNCGNKDSLQTWQRLIIVDRARISNINLEGIQAFDGDVPVEMTGTFSHLNWESALPIRFSEVAADSVLAEAVDAVYYDDISCGACSAYSEGCEKSAVLTLANSGSPGLSSQLVYTIDHWATDTVADIPTLGGNSGRRMESVGIYFAVVSPGDSAHHYAPKSDPSAANWIRVDSGYTGAGYGARCIYAKSTAEVFIGAQDARIFKSADITTGVSVVQSASGGDLNDIHGTGQVVVAVGDTNSIWLSANSGDSFVSVTGPSSGNNLQSIWVVTPYQWYIGSSDGTLWYTMDQGVTFTQRVLPGQATSTEVLDIEFALDFPEVGAIAIQTTGGVGLVYRTVTGGRTWYDDSPGIANLPANERINTVTLCGVNEILAAGKRTGSTDGIVAVAR